jgi:hypothetical protein
MLSNVLRLSVDGSWFIGDDEKAGSEGPVVVRRKNGFELIDGFGLATGAGLATDDCGILRACSASLAVC